MFDIGFFEIVVIVIVALIVVGPERLPGLARKAGLWVAKIKGFVTSVKADIDREIAADELKRVVNGQEESESIYKIIEDTKQAVAEAEKSIKQAESDYVLGTMTDEEVKAKQQEALQQMQEDAQRTLENAQTDDTTQANSTAGNSESENQSNDAVDTSHTEEKQEIKPAALKTPEKVTDNDKS